MRIIFDGDMFVYWAAFAVQKTIRTLKTPDGDTVAQFNSAKDRDEWGRDRGYKSRKAILAAMTEETHVEAEDDSAAIRVFDSIMDYILDASGYDSAIGFLSPRTNFRHDLYPEYKANRKDLVKPVNYAAVRAHAEKIFGMVQGWEADDMVIMEAMATPDDWIIVGEDKDLQQIPGRFFNPKKGTFTDVTPEDALLNFYTQLLTGDRSDNIPGVKGYGPVKAKKALEGKTEAQMVSACQEIWGNLAKMDLSASLLYLRHDLEDTWKGSLNL